MTNASSRQPIRLFRSRGGTSNEAGSTLRKQRWFTCFPLCFLFAFHSLNFFPQPERPKRNIHGSSLISQHHSSSRGVFPHGKQLLTLTATRQLRQCYAAQNCKQTRLNLVDTNRAGFIATGWEAWLAFVMRFFAMSVRQTGSTTKFDSRSCMQINWVGSVDLVQQRFNAY